ncbi:MAG: hypothetical protein FWE44_04550 [Defluviitaleaceae bacterium]|nr:hypothetical protein [Defluviitaleaceae bacterium]
MKRILGSFLLAISVLVLVACGDNGSAEPTQTATTPSQTTPPSNNVSESVDTGNTQAENEAATDIAQSGTPTLGDTFRYRGLDVTFHSEIEFIQMANAIASIQDADGNQVYIDTVIKIPLTVVNVSENPNNEFWGMFGFWGPHSEDFERLNLNDRGMMMQLSFNTIRNFIDADHVNRAGGVGVPEGEAVTHNVYIPFAGYGYYRIGFGISQRTTEVSFMLIPN